MDPVRDIDITLVNGFSSLLEYFSRSGGFMAKNVGEAFKIWSEVLSKKDEITVFLSFPADIIATGLRGVIKEVIKRGWVDIVITTCGTWDHDIARSYRNYFSGSFEADDVKLRSEGIHRLGNVYIPIDNYGSIIEQVMREFLNELYGRGIRELSTYEFSRELGRYIDNENSILTNAYLRDVKIVVPAPYDGAVGYNIWVFQQFKRDFKLNLYLDEKMLMDAVYESNATAGIVLGGGVSKHHLIWWNQFRGGLDYAIQITSAIEYDGSLSGARLSEAVTWNKVKAGGSYTSIWGDVTVILPILVAALVEEGF